MAQTIDKVLLIETDLTANNVLIDTELTTSNVLIDCELDMSSGGRLPNYTGSYIVTPKTVEQDLATKNKTTTADIVVLEIPTEEVSNIFGTSFFIAREG